MISLLFFFIGDGNTLYGMDMTIAIFPGEWDSLFYIPYNGFRTVQGCLNIRYWYQEYQAGFNTPIYRNLRFFYEYGKRDDYRFSEEFHKFSLRIGRQNQYVNIFVIPTFDKNMDEAGVGFGANLHFLWMELNIGVREFDHNYYLSKVNLDTEDPYIKFPLSVRFDLMWINRGYTKLRVNKVFKGVKDVIHNGVHLGNTETGSSKFVFSNVFNIDRRFSAETHLVFREFSGFADEGIGHFMEVPDYREGEILGLLFLKINMGRNYIKSGPSYESHWYYSDTLNYKRRYLMLNVFWKRSMGIPFFTLGIQQSWRRIEGGTPSKNTETRGIIELGFDFNESTHFAIIEGIELDDIGNIKYGLNRIHNHTFVQASHSF